MKKTIRILVSKMEKIQEKKDGSLQGGFASIKGGFNLTAFSNNQSCSNTSDCSHATNTGTPACTNSHICLL